MNRKKKLILAVLRSLKNAGDYQMPESVLHNEMIVTVRPVPTTSEIAEVVRELDQAKDIIGVRDQFEELVYSITTKGQAKLIAAETV